MEQIKKFQDFNEDANANATTAGMGAVTSAQPGALPGTTGTEGSGDIGFAFKKERRKKGDATEVSDMRDLEDSSDKVEEVEEEEVIDETNIVKFSEMVNEGNSSLESICDELQKCGVRAFTDHGKVFIDICEEPELTIEVTDNDLRTIEQELGK